MIVAFHHLRATPTVRLLLVSVSPAPTTPPPVRRQPTRPPSACNKPHSSSSPTQHGNKTCLHCGSAYTDTDNGPLACHYHGHMTGHRGLLSFAPPHQGIDGEWTEESGIIVYKWNSQENRPNTGSSNWKKRWTCCGVYGEDARPCRRGWHVCYDDGATRY